MKKILNIIAAAAVAALLPCAAFAGPDQYIGDTAIYSGTATTTLRPNVLLLIDNSNVTLNAAAGTRYDPTHDYSADCADGPCQYLPYSIYQAGQQGDFSTNSVIDNPTSALANVICNPGGNLVINTLTNNGTYVGSGTAANPNLKRGTGGNAGKLVCDTAPKGATYALGNFLNYTHSTAGATGDSQRKVVYDALQTVIGGARFAVNFGAMVYGSNNKGGNVLYQISDLSDDANFNTFLGLIPGVNGSGTLTGEPVLSSATARPQAESLLDAGYYFWGQGLPVSGQAAMPSPITHSCDKNHVIIITNGLSNKDDDPQLGTRVGDYDHDGMDAAAYGAGTHYLDDVAKFLYESPGTAAQRIVTNTILAFQADDALVRRAADSSHGRGHYYNVANANQLAKALTELLSNIVLETNSSFVAPVVPVSPENRTYSGSRVYMGFFKPISQTYWHGNLKKYGIDSHNNLVDKNGAIANWVDIDGNLVDDNGAGTLPSGATNGTFKSSATSFWSTAADGGDVEAGGAGAVLKARTAARNLYTYTGTNVDLTSSSNLFTDTNAAITPAALGVADAAAKTQLMNFMQGYDAYDENGNGNTSEKRAWVFGDVLHAKPLIVNYAQYAFNAANESDCNVNRSIVYVGANDGVMHAIKDCNGEEAWAFIPPDLLSNLVKMSDVNHTYFVDSSPTVYIYDHNGNGVIETPDSSSVDDKVILIFGERRGGGNDGLDGTGVFSAGIPTTGTYYALDVSNPLVPKFLWSISNTRKVQGTTATDTTEYQEMGETFSEPKIAKLKVGSSLKICAIVGAGYDNINEDSRFGNTLNFPGGAVSNAGGTGQITSAGAITPALLTNAKGRGVYVIELATLDSNGVPQFGSSGNKVWGYTYGATAGTTANTVRDPNMVYSVPSEVSALDINGDGYIDRLYVGDTGGRLWRFNVLDTSVANWTGTMIFDANGVSTSSKGRKFFYKPSITLDNGFNLVFLGSGDREHPLNRGILADRMYGLVDKGQTTAKTENYLLNMETDRLQNSNSTTEINQILADLNLAYNPADTTKYGWYLLLTTRDASGSRIASYTGEKVLASPLAFNKVVYFTTYQPSAVVSTDPCNPGNLGTSRLYAVDYKTAEAVLNYDTGNDTGTAPNGRASKDGKILTDSDRSETLGSGIPSGIVLIITPSGELKVLIGTGGKIAPEDPKKGGAIFPLLWRQK